MYSVDDQDRVEHVTLLAYMVQDKTLPFDGRLLTEADMEMFVEELALVEFQFCHSFMFGWPNDEGFEGHPLASRGLGPYVLLKLKTPRGSGSSSD